MKSKLLAGTLFLSMVAAGPVWAHDHHGVPTPTATPSAVPTPSFSLSSLNGIYVESFSGFANSTPGTGPFGTSSSVPAAGEGTETADGAGNFTANITFNFGGSICIGSVAGTYLVNTDGTGTSTGTFTPVSPAPTTIPNYACPAGMGSETESFVIVGKNRIRFISNDADTVLSGSAVRQHIGSGSGHHWHD